MGGWGEVGAGGFGEGLRGTIVLIRNTVQRRFTRDEFYILWDRERGNEGVEKEKDWRSSDVRRWGRFPCISLGGLLPKVTFTGPKAPLERPGSLYPVGLDKLRYMKG